MKSARKPFNDRPGYVSSRKAELGGYVVIYDREGAERWSAAQFRWVIVYEPTGQYLSVLSLVHARQIQAAVAACLKPKDLAKSLPLTERGSPP